MPSQCPKCGNINVRTHHCLKCGSRRSLSPTTHYLYLWLLFIPLIIIIILVGRQSLDKKKAINFLLEVEEGHKNNSTRER